jgi:very-short-patch-repair endonuclease
MSRTDAERMSNPEAEFLNAWHKFAPGQPDPAYDQRAFDDSQHRFDFQWREKKIAVEIDGGNRMARIVKGRNGQPRAVAVGRHTQSDDYRKRNKATSLGWTVFYFTPEMLRNDPIDCVNQVRSALEPMIYKQNHRAFVIND